MQEFVLQVITFSVAGAYISVMFYRMQGAGNKCTPEGIDKEIAEACQMKESCKKFCYKLMRISKNFFKKGEKMKELVKVCAGWFCADNLLGGGLIVIALHMTGFFSLLI